MVVAVRFSVCCYVRQYRSAGIRVGLDELTCKVSAVIEQSVKGYSLGQRAVVKENVDAPA